MCILMIDFKGLWNCGAKSTVFYTQWTRYSKYRFIFNPDRNNREHQGIAKFQSWNPSPHFYIYSLPKGLWTQPSRWRSACATPPTTTAAWCTDGTPHIHAHSFHLHSVDSLSHQTTTTQPQSPRKQGKMKDKGLFKGGQGSRYVLRFDWWGFYSAKIYKKYP